MRPGSRPLRHLQPLPRHLPDQGVPRALPARCAPLHRLPDDRAQGPHPRRVPRAIGNRVFGCDDCLAVCPWNKFAQAARLTKAAGSAEHGIPAAGRAAVARRCRLPRPLCRHPRQAHGPRPRRAQRPDRRGEFRGCGPPARHRAPARRRFPLVRAMAVWALQRLAEPRPTPAPERRHIGRETDSAVLAEWAAPRRQGPRDPFKAANCQRRPSGPQCGDPATRGAKPMISRSSPSLRPGMTRAPRSSLRTARRRRSGAQSRLHPQVLSL